MAAVGEAYVVIRPKADGFAAELRRQVGPATAAVSRQVADEFSRGGRGRFGRAAAEFGDEAGEGFTSRLRAKLAGFDGSAALGRLRQVGGEVGQAVASSLAVGTAAVAALGTAAVRASSEFNQSMSGVAAVAGASAAELGRLREAALQAGAETAFSASESATAIEELAKAGISTSDILSGALMGSLDLAAAGQLGLADAAIISAQAMNAFGLAGEDVGHVADVLAAAASKSATDVEQMGFALRQSALVANQVGLTLEETVGTLALFADNALVGSDAGTSLKTMLLRLNPTSKESARLMQELGLQFYDAQGAFVGIESVAGQLQRALGGLTEEQRNAALAQLFGTDAVRAATLVMNAGSEGIREYTAKVNDMGAAQRMAAERLNNLKGDIEEFGGSIETALIRTGDVVEPTARRVVQSATEMLNSFNAFAGSPVWARIADRADVLGAEIVGSFAGVAGQVNSLLANISVADVDRVFDRIEAAVARFKESIRGAEIAAAGLGAAVSAGLLRAIPGVGAFVPAITPIGAALAGLVLQSGEARDALGRLASRAAQVGQDLGGRFLETVGRVAATLGSSLGRALETLGAAALNVADVLGPVVLTQIERLAPSVGQLVEAFARLAAEAVVPAAAALSGVLGPAVTAVQPVLSALSAAVQVAADNAGLLMAALGAWAGFRLAGVVAGWVSAVQAFGQAVGQVASTKGVGAMQALTGVVRQSASETGRLASGLVAGLNPAVVGVTAAVAAGVGVYSAWSQAKQRAEQVSRRLADALLREQDTVSATLDALRSNVADLGVTSAAEKARLSLRDVSKELRAFPGAFDEVRRYLQRNEELFTGNVNWSKAIAEAEAAGVRIPAAIRQIRAAAEQGLISDSDAMELVNAFVDADKASQIAGDNIVNRFRDLQSAARDAGVNIGEFKRRFEEATTFEERQQVIRDLVAQFPQLGEAIGETGTASANTAAEIRNLRDALSELASGQMNVEAAQLRFLDAQERLVQQLVETNDAIADNGAEFDKNTAAGRRNREALLSMVRAGNELAAAQMTVDATGQASRATLESMAATLARMRQQGVLTEAQYQELLATYRLTPAAIETRITAQTEQAKAAAADLTSRLNSLPGVSAALKSEIRALIDNGSYSQAEARLAQLERERTATVRVRTLGDLPWFQRILGGFARQADGGLLEFYARGGVREQHVAQIAPAGAWRVWAEPETGGEAYIPLAPRKRRRSEAVLREVARRFGLTVMMDGGLIDSRPAVRAARQPVGAGVTFNGPVTFAGDAKRTVAELDWYTRWRVRSG